jgi:hypothetical protein
MKKLILTLMLLAPILLMGQRVYTDTLSVATDTIIRYRVFDPNFVEGWAFYADTLDGSGMTIEIVGAYDFSSNGYPKDPALIPDSLFTLVNSGLRDTLDAPGYGGPFMYRYVPFDYIGARITINSVTAIFMPHKLITKSQNK